jgi:death-on-curing protein
MIDLSEVLSIHAILIEKFGGASGVRDKELLDSAINSPFATFDGKELYPSCTEKAAALIESIVVNHLFTDGNKRTGYVLMRLLLMQSSLDIIATQDEKYEFVISIAEGKLDKMAIIKWIDSRSVSTNL